jgi:hypothetical protein
VPSPTPGIPDPPLPFTGGRIPSSEDERRFVEGRILRQVIIAPAASFTLLLGGVYVGWPRGAALGVIGFGLTAIWIGTLAVRERRLLFIRGGSMTRREYRYFIYEGVAAVPYGLAYLVGGASLVIASLWFLSGASLDQMRDAALARPSLVLIPLGAALLCYALGFLIGFVHREGSAWSRAFGMLLDAPARLGGLILLAWAVVLLAIGLVDLLSPASFRQGFESLVGNPWPFGP